MDIARAIEVWESTRVSVWDVEQSLGEANECTYLVFRSAKLTSLLKKNKLKSNGKFDTKLRYLIRYYETHPQKLPLRRELALVEYDFTLMFALNRAI